VTYWLKLTENSLMTFVAGHRHYGYQSELAIDSSPLQALVTQAPPGEEPTCLHVQTQ
jgi:hypothetical protein